MPNRQESLSKSNDKDASLMTPQFLDNSERSYIELVVGESRVVDPSNDYLSIPDDPPSHLTRSTGDSGISNGSSLTRGGIRASIRTEKVTTILKKVEILKDAGDEKRKKSIQNRSIELLNNRAITRRNRDIQEDTSTMPELETNQRSGSLHSINRPTGASGSFSPNSMTSENDSAQSPVLGTHSHSSSAEPARGRKLHVSNDADDSLKSATKTAVPELNNDFTALNMGLRKTRITGLGATSLASTNTFSGQKSHSKLYVNKFKILIIL